MTIGATRERRPRLSRPSETRRSTLARVLLVGVIGCAAGCGAPTATPVVVPLVVDKPAKPLDVVPAKPIDTPSDPFEVVMSTSSMCVIVDGKAYCPREITADKPRASGPPLDGISNVASLSFGRDFHCISTRDGKVACGGGNHFGQLGAGIAEPTAGTKALPTLSHVKKVVSGPFSSCAILDDGKLSCWGKNDSGETGSATNVLPDARVVVEPEVVPGIQDVTDVAIAWGATCATTAKGELACWGTTHLPEHRKLRGTQDERPTVLKSLAGATSLTANEQSFCAVRDGKVVCWGQGSMLLPDARPDGPSELAIPGAQRVSLGQTHGCAIGRGGDVYCFGASYSGALGVKTTGEDYRPHAPEKVPGLPPAEKIFCGASLSCALTAGHDLFCWGRFGSQDSDLAPTPTAMRVLSGR